MSFNDTVNFSVTVTRVTGLLSSAAVGEATFNMSETLNVQRDEAGDFYVVKDGASVSFTSIEPVGDNISGDFADSGSYTNRDINGAMVNPGSEALVGSDQTTLDALYGLSGQGFGTPVGSGIEAQYTPANNVDPTHAGSALAVTEGTVFKAISNLNVESDGRSTVDKYQCLSVLDSALPEGTIMGHPWTDAQARKWNVSDIDLAILPRNAPPSGFTKPDIEELITLMKFTRQYHTTNGDQIRTIHPEVPARDGLGYGGQDGYGLLRAQVLQALTFDYTDDELRRLATQVVREGLAWFRRAETGGVREANGGLNLGPYPIVAATALLLNDPDMLAAIDNEGTFGLYDVKQRWHELGAATVLSNSIEYLRTSISEAEMWDVSSATGYAVGDIVEATGGAPWNGNQWRFRIDEVDGNGKLVVTNDFGEVTKLYDTRYYAMPTGIQTITGSGTGLSLSFDRPSRIYNKGMAGVAEYVGNLIATRATSAPNADLRDVYRLNVRRNWMMSMGALQLFTGGPAAINAPEVYDYFERARYFTTGLNKEKLTDFEKAYWDTFNAQSDPAPGAPTIASAGCKDNAIWIKYNKLLHEDPSNGVSKTADYSVDVNGSPVTVVDVYHFADLVNIYIDTLTVTTDTVTVSYTKGTAPDVVQDRFGTEGSSYTDQAVTNENEAYTNPVPSAVNPNADFIDPYNYWPLGPNISAANKNVTFDTDNGSGDVLTSARFDVVGDQGATIKIGVTDISAASITCRLEMAYYDSGGSLIGTIDRVGGSTHEVTANGEKTFSDTIPATAASAVMFYRKMSTGDSFKLDYFSFEYA